MLLAFGKQEPRFLFALKTLKTKKAEYLAFFYIDYKQQSVLCCSVASYEHCFKSYCPICAWWTTTYWMSKTTIRFDSHPKCFVGGVTRTKSKMGNQGKQSQAENKWARLHPHPSPRSQQMSVARAMGSQTTGTMGSQKDYPKS